MTRVSMQAGEEPFVSILVGRSVPDPRASISNGTSESIAILFREVGRNGAEEPAVSLLAHKR